MPKDARISSPFLPEVGQWFDRASHGQGYVFLDPVSGSQLNPNVVPSYISDDPELSKGIAYMQEQGSNIHVTMALGSHEDAEDLGNDIGKDEWFEEQVNSADYFTFEELGYDTQDLAQRLDVAKSAFRLVAENGEVDLNTYEQRLKQVRGIPDMPTFDVRLYRAIARSDTPAFPTDIASDGTQLERFLNDQISKVEEHDDPASHAANLALCALSNAREWCMAAKTGLNIMDSESGNGRRSIEVFDVVGAGHLDKARKFRMLGTEVDTRLFQDGELNSPAVTVMLAAMGRSMATGTILPKDMSEIIKLVYL